MKNIELITQNHLEFLKYLKSRFPLFHKSNIFLRDVEYAVLHFLEEKNIKVSLAESEIIAAKVIESFVFQNLLKRIDNQTWMLSNPEFKTPVEEKAAPKV